MNLRKPFAALCASLLAASLLSLGLSWSAWHVLGRPDYLKTTIRESGIYNTVVTDVLKQKQADLAAGTGLNTDQPQVQSILSKAISPELLQTQTEKVIDGSFAWMQGKTDTLDASLDISGAKQQVANNIGTYAEQYLKALPTCTAGSSMPTSTDPLEATCLPPGYDITAAANEVKQKVLGSDAFKDAGAATAGTQANNGASSIQNQLQGGPHMYQRIQWAIYAQGVITLVSLVGLVLLSTDWRIGMRRVGVISLWTGVVNAALAWLSSFGIHLLTTKLTQTSFNGMPLQQKIAGIAEVIVDDIRIWWFRYGIALAVIGIILLVIYRFVKPTPAKIATSLAKEEGINIHTVPAPVPAAAVGAATPAPTAESAKPATPQTPARRQRPRKVQ